MPPEVDLMVAVKLATEALRVRRDQWQDVADGRPMDVDEQYDCKDYEAEGMVQQYDEALKVLEEYLHV